MPSVKFSINGAYAALSVNCTVCASSSGTATPCQLASSGLLSAGILHFLDGKDDIVGGDRRAVLERGVGPQYKRVGLAVGRDGVTLRQVGT